MKSTTGIAPAPSPLRGAVARPLARRLARGALASAWALRNPREPLATRPDPTRSEPRWAATEDGWELPLRRIPALPGMSGEPVVLATELGAADHTFDAIPESSLARRLHKAGYEVWWFHHRGHPQARSPSYIEHCDMDAVAGFDIPAALERIRAVTGAPRVLWVGHGVGAQVALIYAARGGDRLAGLVSVAAPVRFPRAHTRARVVGRVADWLPPDWRLPVGTIADILAPGPGQHVMRDLARHSSALDRRSLLLHGTEAVRVGLVKQGAKWFQHGHLSDRTGTIDYLHVLQQRSPPLFVVMAEGDPMCPVAASAPLLDGPGDRSELVLDHRFSHFDPFLAPEARETVFPAIETWLADRRTACWTAPVF
jgi:predicted alpha/beta hydrolase